MTLEVRSGSRTATKTADVTVKHKLIVSLGDSLSSGEGNPPWVDARCHRSKVAGVARAAQRLESGSTSVTFLSFACSGAEIDTGVMKPYAGQVPNADCPAQLCQSRPGLLPAQIDAATALLCGNGSTCRSNAPSVDAVFLDIGLNDINFSSIIIRCLNPVTDCRDDGDLNRWLRDGRSQIVKGLDQLAARLAIKPFAGARVFLVKYPDDPFDSQAGCGFMSGIADFEAKFLHTQGVVLNEVLTRAAAKHDWIPVNLAARFAGRGYCSGSPLLRSLSGSIVNQLDKDGTLHPNGAGHSAIADEVVKAFGETFVPRVRVGAVTVTFDSVTIVDRQATQSNGLAPDHTTAAFGFETASKQYGYPISQAQLILFPDHLARIEFDKPTALPPTTQQTVSVYNKNPLVLHVYTTALPPNVDAVAAPGPGGGGGSGGSGTTPRVLQITISHSAADHYGASPGVGNLGIGSHTARRDTALGTIEVRYHVTFQPLTK